MLVALAVYTAGAVVFYAMLVRSAQREPESLARVEANWQDITQQENEAAAKAA
jgi:hypothetical protein